jgi:hypothetical protein
MIDLYLSALTEADMAAALLAAGVIDEDGFPVEGVNLDHIGPFSRFERPTWADEPILVDYPGWHTNLRGVFTDEQLAALEPISIQPAVPYRVWS